jgi:hypothetical protein
MSVPVQAATSARESSHLPLARARPRAAICRPSPAGAVAPFRRTFCGSRRRTRVGALTAARSGGSPARERVPLVRSPPSVTTDASATTTTRPKPTTTIQPRLPLPSRRAGRCFSGSPAAASAAGRRTAVSACTEDASAPLGNPAQPYPRPRIAPRSSGLALHKLTQRRVGEPGAQGQPRDGRCP